MEKLVSDELSGVFGLCGFVGPVAIPARMEAISQGGPIDAGNPSVAYELRRSAAGCGVEVGARTMGC